MHFASMVRRMETIQMSTKSKKKRAPPDADVAQITNDTMTLSSETASIASRHAERKSPRRLRSEHLDDVAGLGELPSGRHSNRLISRTRGPKTAFIQTGPRFTFGGTTPG